MFASLFDLGDAYPHIQADSALGNRARHIFVARTYLESVMHARHPMVRRQFLEALIERHIGAVDIDVDRARRISRASSWSPKANCASSA